jgi:glutaredoxin
MEFKEPSARDFTIYSKSNCSYCLKLKNLLQNQYLPFDEINCDEYLIEEETKEKFFSFIEKKVGKSFKTFPIVFYDNKFVGGYTDAILYIDRLLLFFEELF